MKLRIRGNSLRLRLLRNEVTALAETGKVSEKIGFGNGAALTYTLASADDAEKITANFTGNEIIVLLPKTIVEKWAGGGAVSLEAEQKSGENDILKILIEKDFACIERKDDPDREDAFPNPNVNC